jgi:hypothetical protein
VCIWSRKGGPLMRMKQFRCWLPASNTSCLLRQTVRPITDVPGPYVIRVAQQKPSPRCTGQGVRPELEKIPHSVVLPSSKGFLSEGGREGTSHPGSEAFSLLYSRQRCRYMSRALIRSLISIRTRVRFLELSTVSYYILRQSYGTCTRLPKI